MAPQRYSEIDALRGLAIVLMVLYHLAFDLAYFGEFDLDVLSGGWKFLARTSATLFLLLVGVSFAISYERMHSRHPASISPFDKLRVTYWKYLKRGLSIFGCGMLISFATYFIDPVAFVKFGILHLIGVSTLLLPLFAVLKTWNLVLGLAILSLPSLPSLPTTTSSILLFPLGIPYPGFTSLDYFPLIPWFGVILLGCAFGQRFYIEQRDWRSQLATRNLKRTAPLALLGRHSLMIYLLHQPLLFTLLLMLGLIRL